MPEKTLDIAGDHSPKQTVIFGALNGKEWIIILLLLIAAVLLGKNLDRLDTIHAETAEQTRQTILLKNHSDKLDNDVVIAQQVTLALSSMTRCKP